MNSSPVKPRKIDFNKISFSAPRAMGTSGAKMLFINYDNKPFDIQLPELQTAWDIKYYEDQIAGSGKYQLSLKFSNLEDKYQGDMHSFLEKLDSMLMKACYENRTTWLKKPSLTEEGVKVLYTPLLKKSVDKETGAIDGKWPDQFRIKLVKRENVSMFKLFDENKKEINMDEEGFKLEDLIQKGSKLKGIIRCNGVWIASGKFGCTWKGSQLKCETPVKMKEYAFEDTSSDEEDSATECQPECESVKKIDITDSSSGEEESESESESE